MVYCKNCWSENYMEKSPNDLSQIESILTKLLSKIPMHDSYIKKKFLKKLPRLTLHVKLLTNANIMGKLLLFLR